MKLIILLALIFMSEFLFKSCKTNQVLSPNEHYKMDMYINNMGLTGTGMVVLKEKNLYTIELESAGRFHLFIFRTCSRELSRENASGKIFKRHEVKFNYRPNEIEQRSGCLAEVRAFDRDGKHSNGIIEFEDSSMQLKAILFCGGTTKEWNGVSVCQQRTGLIQKIEFKSDVAYKSSCLIKFKSKNILEFEMPEGLCTTTFMEKKPPHKAHRLTTYGYNKIAIRE